MIIDSRFVLYHKQATSARTLFLHFASGTILAPKALPFLSSPLESGAEGHSPALSQAHPASLVRELSASLDLPESMLEIDPEFRELIEVTDGQVDAYLARFTCIDPPREQVAAIGASFRAITELRGGHPVEMELLRKAYQHVLGG